MPENKNKKHTQQRPHDAVQANGVGNESFDTEACNSTVGAELFSPKHFLTNNTVGSVERISPAVDLKSTKCGVISRSPATKISHPPDRGIYGKQLPGTTDATQFPYVSIRYRYVRHRTHGIVYVHGLAHTWYFLSRLFAVYH